MSAVRRSARAIVLDEDDRVLLLHGAVNETPRRFAWYLPGGRLEAGETFEDAVTRELAEELGLGDVSLGPWVWTRHGHRLRDGQPIPTESRFFLVRTVSFVPDLTDIGTSEIDVAWRWWSTNELDGEQAASFIPVRLATLVRSLVEGNVPVSPLDVSG